MYLKKGLFRIKNKEGKKVQFIRNEAQRDFAAKVAVSTKRKRIIVKARQLGFTTDICADKTDKVMTRPFYSCYIIAHKRELSSVIFEDKIKFLFDNIHPTLRAMYKTKSDNANELRFENQEVQDSWIRVGTSARGLTVQELHVTEAGKIGSSVEAWTELVTGSFEAAQDITLEGTAEGLNLFYDFVMDHLNDSRSDWDIFFYNWTWAKEYTLELPPDKASWVDAYIRLAKQYSLIENPQEQFKLSDGQFYWYYRKAREQHEKVKQEYPFTLEEAFVSSGRTFFNLDLVQERLVEARELSSKIIDEVTIYQPPQPGEAYVCFVDPATGEGEDSSNIQVWSLSGIQVAHLDGLIPPEQTARIACNLSHYYNFALLGIESNGVGISTLNFVLKSGYKEDRIYRRYEADPASPRNIKVAKYGWNTSAYTRPIMLDDLRHDFNEGRILINDPLTLTQMKTVVRNEKGRVEHEQGKHDDSVMCAAGALQLIRQYNNF